MFFFQIRCPICFKHFCCSAHRTDHQVKCHTESFAPRQNNQLVKVFKNKAQTSLFWTQNYQGIRNTRKQSQVTKVQSVPLRPPTVKRLHSAINKRILSTSVTVTSHTRRILVPVHRFKLYNAMKDDNEEVILRDSTEKVKKSPCVDENVKTSTPIISPLPDYNSQIIWNISSESTISNYQTPCAPSPGQTTKNQLNVKTTKNQLMNTPLRGIIMKASKYDSDSASPSPGPNTSRSRRVTFSSSSLISSSSTPLESIEEVEICEEIENTYNHLSAKVRNRYTEDIKSSDKFGNIRTFLEDSTPPIKDNGFLSCMTNVFCSAIHTIPSLASWRKTETNSMLNRSKRSRSPDDSETHYLDIETPLQKRPCYPTDLRKNPIQSRRPISKK